MRTPYILRIIGSQPFLTLFSNPETFSPFCDSLFLSRVLPVIVVLFPFKFVIFVEVSVCSFFWRTGIVSVVLLNHGLSRYDTLMRILSFQPHVVLEETKCGSV